MIKKTNNKYKVVSHKNPKKSFGTYTSLEKAKKRLAQIAYFKHLKK